MLGYADEKRRLSALVRTGLLSAQSDETFLSLVNAAAGALGVPISTISLIDQDKQIYFEKYGITATETERSVSFCSRTIENDAPLVVLDASRDPLWRDNPLVQGEPYIRFYAGVPLYIESQPVGTFCVIDTVPHECFTDVQRQLLQRYARIAGEMLELRSLKAQVGRERNHFRRFSETSLDAMMITDGEGYILHWNGGAERLFGYGADEARHLRMTDLVPEGDREPTGFRPWIDAIVGQTREVDAINRTVICPQ